MAREIEWEPNKPCGCHEEIAALRKAVKDTWREGWLVGRRDTIKEIKVMLADMVPVPE